MSIYSRSYMRDSNEASPSGPWALKWIMIALVVVFLVQNIAVRWFEFRGLEQWLALSLPNLQQGYLHTLFTYGLLHSTSGVLPWHLLLNGLFLWLFGREIEARIGSQRFLEVFLLSILTGGFLWLLIHMMGSGGSVIGASGGVFGIILLFCRFHWFEPMGLFPFPMRLNGKQLFWVFAGIQLFFLLFAEIPGQSTTAHSAHLGGMLGAFLYERYCLHRTSLTDLFRRRTEVIPPSRKRQKANAVKAQAENRYTVNLRSTSHLKVEVDRILDKINEEGFGSLTDEEKELLDKAKDVLR